MKKVEKGTRSKKKSGETLKEAVKRLNSELWAKTGKNPHVIYGSSKDAYWKVKV